MKKLLNCVINKLLISAEAEVGRNRLHREESSLGFRNIVVRSTGSAARAGAIRIARALGTAGAVGLFGVRARHEACHGFGHEVDEGLGEVRGIFAVAALDDTLACGAPVGVVLALVGHLCLLCAS